MDGKWTIIKHENPCLTCASPWCNYKQNKDAVDSIIEEVIKKDDRDTHRKKSLDAMLHAPTTS